MREIPEVKTYTTITVNDISITCGDDILSFSGSEIEIHKDELESLLPYLTAWVSGSLQKGSEKKRVSEERKKMTGRQKQVFDFILDFKEKHMYFPTIREITDSLGFASANSVSEHVAALEKKGYIKRIPKMSRGFVIL